MSTPQTDPEATIDEHGPCVVCNAPVTVRMRRDGAIVLVDAQDYSGLTDDGDSYVCRDHYCRVCGGSHTDAIQFDTCEFNGVDDVDLTPPCSVEVADAVLRALGVRA